jgi:excisionase family DNA binding protein
MPAQAAAAVMAVSLRHVRRLIAGGALPPVRIGRAVRVRVRDVRALTRPE